MDIISPAQHAALSGAHGWPAEPVPDRTEAPRRLIGAIRRHWIACGALFLVIFGAVALYTFTRTRLYSATAGMVVNSRELNIAEKDKEVLPGLPTNQGAPDTEVEILRSTAVATATVRALDLVHHPLFAKAIVKLPPEAQMSAATAMLKADVKISRPGESNVVSIAYVSPDPVLAKAVADQIGRQYLAIKAASRRQAVGTVDAGLGREIEDLRVRLETAEADVARYKTANNLLSADGVTLTEQELSLYKQQDATARAVQAQENARLRTARSQLARGSQGDDVGAALQSPVIQQLRTQRAETTARLAELQAKYQPGHPDLVKARDQVADIDQAIRAETRRVISNLDANARVAADSAANARATAYATSGTLAVNNAASVRLNELQRKADGLKESYQTLLGRRNSIRSQALVAGDDAQLFSPALLPLSPSSPNRPLMLAIGLVLAAIAAGALLWLLEALDRGIAGSRGVEAGLGLPNLALLPHVATIARADEAHIAPIDFAIQRPLSLYAEALRAIRLAVIGGHPNQHPIWVGVTSACAGEGKTTLAVSLARASAQAGSRVLLVDADLRRPAVARLMGLRPAAGLVELLEGRIALDAALIEDDASGLMILPIRQPRDIGGELFDQARFDRLISACRDRFDLVIVDAAPALVAADARQLLRLMDDVLMAVQWRKTPRPTAIAALRRLRAAGIEPLGAVLTQVDMKALARSGEAEADYALQTYGALQA
jgi:succinoglycan biosynthesis transport protein ExoP